jgi:hypothetical protein
MNKLEMLLNNKRIREETTSSSTNNTNMITPLLNNQNIAFLVPQNSFNGSFGSNVNIIAVDKSQLNVDNLTQLPRIVNIVPGTNLSIPPCSGNEVKK